MARVTWHIEGDELNTIKNASLPPPASGGELWGWWRAAYTALDVIPDPHNGKWFLSHSLATLDTIIFELHSDNGEKGLVVIDRRVPSIGT